MSKNYQLDVGIYFKRFFQSHRVHVPGIVFGVNKHGNAALIDNGIHCGIEGHITGRNPMPVQRPLPQGGLTVKLFPCQLHCQMQRGSTGGQGHCILAAHLPADSIFCLVDIFSNGGHPVGAIGLHHIIHGIRIHGWRRKPHFLFKWMEMMIFRNKHLAFPLLCVSFNLLIRIPQITTNFKDGTGVEGEIAEKY